MPTALVSIYSKTVDQQFGLEWETVPSQWRRVYHTQPMNGLMYRMQGLTDYGVPKRREPLQGYSLDSITENFGMNFFPKEWGMGDLWAKEDAEDDPTNFLTRLAARTGGAVARAFANLEEEQMAGYLINYAFASGTGVAGSPDGVALCSTAHPMSKTDMTTTWSNRPSTDCDPSVAYYQAGAASLMQQKASNNHSILRNDPVAVVTNPNFRYLWRQILQSAWTPGTGNRDQNYSSIDNVEIIEWPFFRKSGATGTWNASLILGRTRHLHHLSRQPVKTKVFEKDEIGAICLIADVRFTLGHSDAHGVYGTPGG